MADRKPTVFQNFSNFLFGRSMSPDIVTTSKALPPADINNRVLYTTSNKEDYERKLLQYKQQKLLSYQWQKAGKDTLMTNAGNYTAIKLMYKDGDLMAATPEIGTAIDIMAEEACNFNSEGKMVKISSKSKRIKAILEDLFENRLNIHILLPMIANAMIKYGNEFMLLNIDQHEGVMGWRELPVYEIDRVENGYTSMTGIILPNQDNDLNPDETKFVWVGRDTGTVYRDWQVAHFRLLKDSLFLPYGNSLLHKARRAWRMWSMMEDSMLLYRLDKSVARRIFKVYVGAMDDADIPAFMDEFANNFKRTPIVDPETGQVDLRKNFISVDSDVFIPFRTEDTMSKIESMPSEQNPTSMEDIQYMQNKVFAALRTPKTFLNFQEAQGKGQNLSLMDIRFSRMINTIQQFLLCELTKVAMVHLHVLGLDDELGNFTLSMNNPSSQIEAAEIEDLTKRINTATAALADPGTGIPLLSIHYVYKKILKLSDREIKDILNEIRLEKAMAAELAQTQAIIKKTGMFDEVDRIYGDYDVLHGNVKPQANQEGMGDELGGPGGGLGGASLGGGMDDMDSLGGAGTEDMGDLGGEEGDTDMENAPETDNGGPMESTRKSKKPMLNEIGKFTQQYFDLLGEYEKDDPNYVQEPINLDLKNKFLNEKITKAFDKIDNILENGVNKIVQSDFDKDFYDEYNNNDE